MERISKEEMEAEFGLPGVQNPKIVDLIAPDNDSGRVVLTMVERRGWGGPRQLQEIEEKINRYLGYVLDGYLAEQYPEYLGKRVLIRLECAQEPHGESVAFLGAAKHAIEAHGLEFVVTVKPAS